jgi:hypothetical protein
MNELNPKFKEYEIIIEQLQHERERDRARFEKELQGN